MKRNKIAVLLLPFFTLSVFLTSCDADRFVDSREITSNSYRLDIERMT